MGIINIDPHAEGMSGTFIIACDHCRWTTLDIGMHFDRPTKLIEKLAAAKKEARTKQAQAAAGSSETNTPPPPPPTDPEETFTALKSFMSLQISSAGSTNPLLTPGGSYNYDSPSSLARIMSMYTGHGTYSKKNTSKSSAMRESADATEGLHVLSPHSDAATIQTLRHNGLQSSPTLSQRHSQRFPSHSHSHSHSHSSLLPVPTLLHTKRAKRCRICRHILVKPDAKVLSTRYRIRLIALNYIPTITLKPLPPASSSSLPPTTTTTTPSPTTSLPPLSPTQHLLTLRNPLFDPLKITLATPSHTPGPYPHRITILCPEFSIGANADAWDEALAADNNSNPLSRASTTTEGMRVAEAGKVWDKGRNWTSVVVEVVCKAVDGGEEAGEEDADVVEIPVFVRMEYEAEVERVGGGGGGEGEGKGGREKRELAFWVVVGVGRVGRMFA